MSNKMDYVEKSQPRARRTASRTAAKVAPVEVEDVESEDVETEQEPSPAEEWVPTAPTGRRFNLLTVVGVALAVLVVAGLVVSVLEWTGSNSRYDSQQSLRAGALEAASSYGVYLSSYNYQNLDGAGSPWAEVDAHSTPSFRKDFDSTKSNLTSLVNDYKATATGKVIAAGLNSVNSSRAVALLFIDQTVTNTAQKPGTTTQPLRVELVMARQNGHWLIDKLEVPS